LSSSDNSYRLQEDWIDLNCCPAHDVYRIVYVVAGPSQPENFARRNCFRALYPLRNVKS
jgi:hypothetical protein